MTFCENPHNGSQVVLCGQTDGCGWTYRLTDMMKLIIAFHACTNETCVIQQYNLMVWAAFYSKGLTIAE